MDVAAPEPGTSEVLAAPGTVTALAISSSLGVVDVSADPSDDPAMSFAEKELELLL